MLPDEIISEILSPALKVSDELFSDTSHVSPFANYTPSTSAYLVVCKDWLRVATPLLYNVIVLRSNAQATALEAVLRHNPEFGRFIKKLRVEGAYGKAMHTILKSAPNITDLFLSLSVWSSDNTQGLCKGLPLVNPTRVIVVDPYSRKTLKNKQLDALTKALFSCIRTWDSLRIVGFPYGSGHSDWKRAERALNFAEALTQSPTVRIVILSSSFYSLPQFLLRLCKIPSLQALEFKSPFYVGHPILSASLFDPQLKAVARYTMEDDTAGTETASFVVPDITPSLNLAFVPMQSASEETQETVWKRVLFFSMYVEELRSPSFPRLPTKTHPSRLPILRVSKYFNRIGLPYLYDCPTITVRSTPSMSKQLQEHPDLGSFIRSIFIPPNQRIHDDCLHTILSHATNVERFLVIEYHDISTEILDLMARNAGHSLRELTIGFRGPTLSTALLAHFTELRILELRCYTIGNATSDSTIPEGLKTLPTLRIHGVNISFLDIFAAVRLESLHTLSLPSYSGRVPTLLKFFKEHGSRLLHLTIGYVGGDNFGLFDYCKNLIDVEFQSDYNAGQFTCETHHNSLVKIVAEGLPDPPGELKFDMFPALREIHIHSLNWPTTEREINKSKVVPFAESLLLKNIKLMDSAGKHWTPRVKTTKGRKR
ncbi:hypothetical protein B0H11DRAFT_1878501 [Mycena galericulata]|nr:hypothetical protein B0H11DRAFT_1878501 [Mycena galericulata]